MLVNTGSDYDLRAHEGNLQLDLQSIDLPDSSVDVVMCAHVLEHVPDTDKALGELRRVIRPGGIALLSVRGSVRPGPGARKPWGKGSHPWNHKDVILLPGSVGVKLHFPTYGA